MPPESDHQRRKVFFCYRREDSLHATGRICDWVIDAFGKHGVFKDVDSIPISTDFREHINAVLTEAAVVVVVIGQKWLTCSTADGGRRIDEPGDYVRLEIETALQHNVPVIPALIDGARTPRAIELPPEIKDLAYRQSATLRSDPHFVADVRTLIRAIEEVSPLRNQNPIVSSAPPPGWRPSRHLIALWILLHFFWGAIASMEKLPELLTAWWEYWFILAIAEWFFVRAQFSAHKAAWWLGTIVGWITGMVAGSVVGLLGEQGHAASFSDTVVLQVTGALVGGLSIGFAQTVVIPKEARASLWWWTLIHGLAHGLGVMTALLLSLFLPDALPICTMTGAALTGAVVVFTIQFSFPVFRSSRTSIRAPGKVESEPGS